ncbi:MAG: MFS transporter [Pseudomonadota bacterium]
MTDRPASALTVTASASLISAVLGSIHAFSVLIVPLEDAFGAGRSAVALTYSLALVALTLAVLFGPAVYGRASAARFVALVAVVGAGGAFIASTAPGLITVWLGYSLVFGAANGLGYGFGLQIAAQVNPGREGLAMGIVTAAYALGAMLSPALFDGAVASGGFGHAMRWLALSLAVSGAASALLLWRAGARFQAPPRAERPEPAELRAQALLWCGYFASVLAGLMVIGHAAGIAQSFQPDLAAWIAPALIAACNLAGSLAGGRLADLVPLRHLLAGLAVMSASALAVLAADAGALLLLLGLGAIGFTYGGTISAYPAAVVKLFGMARSPQIYGRVFTAWGAAGLLGPWLAGMLFDLSGAYRPALFAAALLSLSATVAVFLLFPKKAVGRPGEGPS